MMEIYLLLLGVYAIAVDGTPNWRYRSSVGEQDVFDLKNDLILEYLGNGSSATIEWTVSESCVAADTSQPTTTLRCNAAGQQKITLTEGEYRIINLIGAFLVLVDAGNSSNSKASTTLITFKRKFECYRWHVALNSTIIRSWHPGHQHWYKLRSVNVWIVDEAWASEEEMKFTAELPSESSKRLTNLFFETGQLPTIRLDVHGSAHSHDVYNELSGYDHDKKCWVFFIDAAFPDYNVEFQVTGLAISRYECSVKNTVMLMPIPKFQNLTSAGVDKVLLTGSTTETRLFRDPCARHILALVTASGKFLFTQDNFITTYQVYADVSGLDPAPTSLVVSEVAFLHDYFAIRVGDKVYLVDREKGQLSVPENSPVYGVQHIGARYWCDSSNNALIANSVFATWNGEDLYIYGLNGVQSFTKVTVPHDLFHTVELTNLQVSIIDVTFHQFPGPILGVVAKLSGTEGTRLVVLLYQSKTQTWKLLSLMLDLTAAPSVQQEFKLFFQLASTDFYLYNRHSVYTAWKGGQSVDPLMLLGCSSTVLASTDEIKQLTANPSGDVLVLMTSNIVYYGKFGSPNLIKFMEMEPPSYDLVFNFDALSNLFMVQIQDANITKRRYPLRNEIISVLYPNYHCVYSQFFHNILDFYVLDIRDRLTLWAVLVYPQIRGNHMKLITSQDLLHENTILQVDEVTEQVFMKGMVAENKTMTFYVGSDFYGIDNYFAQRDALSGTVNIDLHPIQVNLACKPPIQVTSYINTGCPEGRMMKLRRSLFTENCTIPDKYTIEKKYSQSGVDELIYYDESLGCLLQVHINDDFLPVFDIYDHNDHNNGEEFVSTMDTNFIVWEENGREDFSYKQTMLEAECKLEAQTWARMRTKHPNLPDKDIWGPENYRDCFIDDSMVVGDLSQKYEILNRTSSNAMTFEVNHNGIFIFRAKVVDPNYSFCSFEARFAVYVYGWLAEDRVTPLVVSSILFTISTIVFIIGSYTIFKRKINAEMELQNLKDRSEVPLIASLSQAHRRHSVVNPMAVPSSVRPMIVPDIMEPTED